MKDRRDLRPCIGREAPYHAAKEAIVQTSVHPNTPSDASCGDAAPPTSLRPDPMVSRAPLFPPRDADPETRRRWLASSPWPEIVFASAGGW